MVWQRIIYVQVTVTLSLLAACKNLSTSNTAANGQGTDQNINGTSFKFNIGPEAELEIVQQCYESTYQQFQANYPNNWTGSGWAANVAALGTSDAQRCHEVAEIYQRSMQFCLATAQVNFRFYRPVNILRKPNVLGLGTHLYVGYARIAKIDNNVVKSTIKLGSGSDFAPEDVWIADPWREKKLNWRKMPADSVDDANGYSLSPGGEATFYATLKLPEITGSPKSGSSDYAVPVDFKWSSANLRSQILKYGKMEIFYQHASTESFESNVDDTTQKKVAAESGSDAPTLRFQLAAQSEGSAKSKEIFVKAILKWLPNDALPDEKQEVIKAVAKTSVKN